MPSQPVSLNQLWQAAPVSDQVFNPAQLAPLPEPARRYLDHAIAPGTPLATAVRLKMHGEIKLKTWQSFQAEQVICWQQGMIWQAKTRISGLPVSGWDRLVDGAGAMQWKLLGWLPVITAAGDDITRSAIGRMQGECVWLPSVFCNATWTASDNTQAQARLTLLGETTDLTLTLSESGRLEQFCFQRWGNPEGAEYHSVNFGGYLEAEGSFSGYTIPTRLRGGWYFGSDRFGPEGEFFHATIDEAIYR
jgi:hypothetical protein